MTPMGNIHDMSEKKSVVMMGATGAVGSQVVQVLKQMDTVERVALLGRRAADGVLGEKFMQHVVDVLDRATYAPFLAGHTTAICTLGVGQPSKVTKDEFLKIDRDAVVDFAAACRDAGIRHFQLLSSVGADPESASFYLRGKGELEQSLKAMQFEQLSLFHPSMILTPQNRYGPLQGLTLIVWPWLRPLLSGPLRKFRGIKVDLLGRAIALNTDWNKPGVQTLEWDEILSVPNVGSPENDT